MIASPTPWQYRSHITFHVTPDGELGFVATDDQHITPIQECHIIRPELLDLFDSLDLEGGTGLTRVRLQVGSASTDRSIILSTEDNMPPEIDSDMHASVNFLAEDNEPLNLIGSTHVRYTIRGRSFRVSAGGFFQVNFPQAEVLIDQGLMRLDLQGGEAQLEL